MTKPVVLITGASSGIGKALALALAEDGAVVYGTSRNPQPMTGAGAGPSGSIRMIALDVCSEESAERAVADVVNAEGRIDILINNAGSGICGAIEDTSVAEAQRQFETNFFGVLRMCRHALPVMRNQQSGLIINIGSVAGHIAIPYQSMYSASKFALQALTEALRIEVKPFGIRAAIVDPGDIKTGFTENRKWVEAASGSPYEKYATRAIESMAKSEMGAPEPAAVVKVVRQIIKTKKPPVRVVVGWNYKLIVLAKQLLPAKLLEYVLTRIY